VRATRRFISASFPLIVPIHAAQWQMHHLHITLGFLVITLISLAPPPANASSQPALENTRIVSPAQVESHRTNKFQQGKFRKCANTSCSVPAHPNPAPRTYSFQEVWDLILKHHSARKSHFTPELIACLMWEESGFRLVENPISHSLGFGQVLPSTVREINKRYKKSFTRQLLLTSPDASVEATILALEIAWDWKKEKVGALFAYAGGIKNFEAVRKWLTAEPHLLRARISHYAAYTPGENNNSGVIADALHICSQPGFDPQNLF
jgi:hypothetical protein